MTLAVALVLALAFAAIVLVVVELAQTRARPVVWAVGLVAIAQLIAELSRQT